MTSLQQITNAWGWWAADNNMTKLVEHWYGDEDRHHTHMNWSVSTNYSAQSDAVKYSAAPYYYQVKNSAVPVVTYDWANATTSVENVKSMPATDDNITPSPITTTERSFSKAITESSHWDQSVGLDIGIEVSATGGIPEVASTTVKGSLMIKLSAGRGGSIETTNTITVNSPKATILPFTSLDQTLIVTQSTVSVPYTTDVVLSGSVGVWFQEKIDLNKDGNYHWLWFPSLGSVLNQVNSNNLNLIGKTGYIDTTGYKVLSDGSVAVHTSGVYTGINCTASHSSAVSYQSVADIAAQKAYNATHADAGSSSTSNLMVVNTNNVSLVASASDNLERLNHTVTGSSGNDLLTGSSGGNDVLLGMAGNDTLIGGGGADTLTGGLGKDVFKFDVSFDSVKSKDITIISHDTITDFSHKQGDKIDLSGIDANTKLAGDQAFKFIGTKAFSTTDATGQLRFDVATHTLHGSENASDTAEFSVQLNGVNTVVLSDLIL